MRFEADTFQCRIQHIISQAFLNHRARYACRIPQDAPATFLLGRRSAVQPTRRLHHEGHRLATGAKVAAVMAGAQGQARR